MIRHAEDGSRRLTVDERTSLLQVRDYSVIHDTRGVFPYTEVSVELERTASGSRGLAIRKLSEHLGRNICIECGLCPETDRRSEVLFPSSDADASRSQFMMRSADNPDGGATFITKVSGFACNGDPANIPGIQEAYTQVLRESIAV